MDGWTERQDGQDRWEYGMNHMDGKDEEEIDDEFFSFLYFSLSFTDDQHSFLSAFLLFIFELPYRFTP